MGEWAAAADPVPAPQPAAGPGFHQALCGCLKALEGGDRESCGSLLDAAGVAVVRAGRPLSPFVLKISEQPKHYHCLSPPVQ